VTPVTLVTPFPVPSTEKLFHIAFIYSDVIEVTRVVPEISVTGVTAPPKTSLLLRGLAL
jgi:hypothetical protein